MENTVKIICPHCKNKLQVSNEEISSISMGVTCACNVISHFCIACGDHLAIDSENIPIFGSFFSCKKCGFENPALKDPEYYTKDVPIEVTQFILHRRQHANIINLEMAVNLLLNFQSYLYQFGKSLRFANEEDISEFMKELQQTDNKIDQKLIVRILIEFFDVLEKHGMQINNPAVDVQDRQSTRIPFKINANFIGIDHRQVAGYTEDISQFGTRMLSFGKISPDLKGLIGLLEFHLDNKTDSRAIIALPARIIRVEKNHIAFRVYSYMDLSGNHFIHNETVCSVMRSNGHTEPDWRMVPFGSKLPDSILDKIMAQHDHGPLVVCMKNRPGSAIFRVIPLTELVDKVERTNVIRNWLHKIKRQIRRKTR